MLALDRMHPRTFVFITLLALCHPLLRGQMLTNVLPPQPQQSASPSGGSMDDAKTGAPLPDDPEEEALPIAQPEPPPADGTHMRWEAKRQTLQGDTRTLDGDVTIYYRDYVIRADKVVYHQSTSELDADGHLRVTGGPDDIDLEATHGDMRLEMHTARFFNVTG